MNCIDRNHSALNNLKNQAGSVLLICLILLLAITLLGVSSMNSTLVEHRILSNTRSQTLALTGAEAALNEAIKLTLGQAGTEKKTGLKLRNIQSGTNAFNTKTPNENVKLVIVKLGNSHTITIPVWEPGAVTENADYLNKYTNREAWWSNSKNTAALSNDLSKTNKTLEENNYRLSSNPRFAIEKGKFIPDDLSPTTLAEYRGRQVFTTLSRATGSKQSVEASLQASVVTRYR